MLLLAEAVERLAVRPILAAREKDRSARAAANVGTFLERARNNGVKGLKRFVRDMMKEWQAGTPCQEGRIDAEGDAIAIVTMHSSKGLEWHSKTFDDILPVLRAVPLERQFICFSATMAKPIMDLIN